MNIFLINKWDLEEHFHYNMPLANSAEPWKIQHADTEVKSRQFNVFNFLIFIHLLISICLAINNR